MTPPRPLEQIEQDIRAIEQDIVRMRLQVTGGGGVGVKPSVGTWPEVPTFANSGVTLCRVLYITPYIA